MMLGAGDFIGTWKLDRSIDDRLSGQTGDFRGSATFREAEPAHLSYAEVGKMQFAAGGPVFTAERTYKWRFLEQGVAVFFADGAPFHSFDPQGQAVGTTHLCGDDLYNVTYDFRDWPVWTAAWEVQGPRKDYTSVSRYTRD